MGMAVAGLRPHGRAAAARRGALDKTVEKPIEPYEVPLPPYGTMLSQGTEKGVKSVPHRYIVGENGLTYSQGILFK